VARYGLAFDMRVTAFDPYLVEWPGGVGRASSIEELMEGSDVVTLHVPLNETTRGLVGERQLALLPRGAVVVNTSRGALIDGPVDGIEPTAY
jgi:phosphoglycerate dehydrogenase-like enzyme